MASYEELIQLVSQVNQKYNEILQLAKEIFEFDDMSEVDDQGYIVVSIGGETKKLKLATLLSSVVSTYVDRLISIGVITIVDNTLTIPSGCQWQITNVNYFTSSDFEQEIDFTSGAGYIRKDIIYGNASNELVYFQGVEGLGVAFRPNIPIGTVLVTEINVTDSGFDYVVSSDFVKKLEFSETIITGTGVLNIPLDSENTSFRLTDDLTTQIEGTTPTSGFLSTFIYVGKEVSFANSTANAITFKHTTDTYGFRFADETDFVVEPNEVIVFRFAKTDTTFLEHKSISRVAPGSSGDVTMTDVDNAEQAAKDYADSLVVGLWDDRGPYNPTTNSNLYPTFNGSGTAGAILKGDLYTISGLGSGITTTVGSKEVQDGDTVRALSDVPGQTESNWAIAENNIGYVAENSANKTDDESTSITETVKYFSVKGFWNSIKLKLFTNIPAKGTALVDADTIALGDSEDSGKTKTRTWAQIKETLNTYFSTLFKPQSTAVTTLTVTFTSENIHYTDSAPGTGNVLVDLTGAKRGLIQKMYHNSGTAPTFPAGFVKKGSGNYQASVLNEIYFEWAGGSRVEYWIIKY